MLEVFRQVCLCPCSRTISASFDPRISLRLDAGSGALIAGTSGEHFLHLVEHVADPVGLVNEDGVDMGDLMIF